MNTETFKNTVLPLSDQLFPMVARILGNQESARDAVQVIMMKLWDKRKELAKHPNIPGFVFVTARNYCLDLLKKKRWEPIDAMPILQNLESGTTGLEELERKELYALVEGILEALPEKQREVILLRDLDGLTFEEICALTQLKVEHVRVLLSRARKQVSVQLEKIYSYEQGKN